MKFERMDLVCTRHNEVLRSIDGMPRPALVPDGDPTADDFTGVWRVDFEDLTCPQWVEDSDECQDDWTAKAVED